MSKRKRPEGPELPLFDLPLHADDEAVGPPEGLAELETDAELPLGDAGDLPIAPGQREDPQRTYAEIHTAEDDHREEQEEGPEPRAPFWDRLLSGLLDLGIQLLVVGAAVAASRSMGLALGLDDWMPFVVLGLIFSFLYWFIPLAFWGQTPGMAWVGNSALSLSDDPLTFGQSVLRWLGALLTVTCAGLPLLFALAGRSLTDRLSDSKTVVL